MRYSGLYLSAAHPQDAAGLLMHMRQVSYLHSQGLGYAWREFDTRFRRAQELSPAHHQSPLMTASSSIWLSAVATGTGSMASMSAGLNMTDRAGFRQVCFQFNDGNCRRQRCQYLHICRSCCGPHSLGHCPRRAYYPVRQQLAVRQQSAPGRANSRR